MSDYTTFEEWIFTQINIDELDKKTLEKVFIAGMRAERSVWENKINKKKGKNATSNSK